MKIKINGTEELRIESVNEISRSPVTGQIATIVNKTKDYIQFINSNIQHSDEYPSTSELRTLFSNVKTIEIYRDDDVLITTYSEYTDSPEIEKHIGETSISVIIKLYKKGSDTEK